MVLKTRHKIFIARCMSRVLRLGRLFLGAKSKVAIISRKGVRWSVDLTEGLDLSIYLLGTVEPRLVRAYQHLIRTGDVVIDIGANIGGHTFHFAKCTGPTGTVLAVEASDWAFRKLTTNLELNPGLATVIRVRQSYLGAPIAEGMAPAKQDVYASWPLTTTRGLHEKHMGRITTVDKARYQTLDSLVAEEKLTRVDFIKIDVDGNEWGVIQGAKHTLKTHRPIIVMEFAPYLFSKETFQSLVSSLKELNYGFSNAETGEPFPDTVEAIRNAIADGASENVLLTPA